MTSRILMEKLSFSYVTGEEIFADLSLDVPMGWLGVVGANGSGKTTFLHLLEGRLQPTGGILRVEPEWTVVAHCPQSVDALDPTVLFFAQEESSDARRWRARLHLDAQDLERWPTLSPGERKRWQVAAALSSRPMVLLLDEPSNHLDVESRGLLMEALADFHGVGVVVSHDRALLDALCHRTFWLEEGVTPNLYEGAYSQALLLREQAQAAAEARYAEADAGLRKARRQAKAAQERSLSLQRARHASARRRNVGDREAASMSAKVRFDRAARSGTRGASQAERLAASAEEQRERLRMARSHRGPIHFDWEPPRQRMVLDVPRATLSGQGLTLPDRPYFQLGRSEKLRISGPNGAGKSTLMRHLRMHFRLEPSRIFYLPQELREEEGAALVQDVLALSPSLLGRLIPLFTRLGASSHKLLRGDPLSPGDLRKLSLAHALAGPSQLLLLDEPTNHLDLPAVEALQAALVAYPGAIVLISHDEVFAQEVTEVEWMV